ncbi:ribose-phosphate pyrophosphokinase [Methylohalomonas lacus]|uniref:Ribose-phosphate pyrophosphokinase n=1 Tax=Methylohalomonas lacus TaxID=398773 RepID=A0AAE3L0S7_9GAMM|nr:ribose-phosphate pyrophosphokinase [Methylohalomonas lacus]MCS3902096.1 ribose-phosphate pyrophosphokinase [Methylohalomonas lacus]
MSASNMMVFTGNANPRLAMDIAGYLSMPLGKVTVGRFSDGEVMVDIGENVRNRDIFIIQSICAPVNESLMELLVMADAMYRASASSITAVIPYMGYARQDRRPRSARVPISAKVVANMIAGVGIDRAVTVDLHADQIQGFFDIPLDNVYASPVLLGDIWKQKHPNLMVVSPDVGGVVRARALAKRLDDTTLAIIDKRRPNPNESEVMNIIGDVRGKTCVIIDDLVDTAGTLCHAANALKDHGAEKVFAYCTHPVLSGNAVKNIEGSALDEMVTTDTIPLKSNAAACKKIRQLSVAAMMAESMRRICEGESLSSMFVE